MKTQTFTLNTYSFSELDGGVQEKLIEEQIDFLLQFLSYEEMSDGMKKAVEKAESLRTPWFTTAYVWDYCKDEITAHLSEEEYLKNGELVSYLRNLEEA